MAQSRQRIQPNEISIMESPDSVSTAMVAIDTSSSQPATVSSATSPPSIANLHEDDVPSTHILDPLESAAPEELASTYGPTSDASCQSVAISAACDSDLMTNTMGTANADAAERTFTLFPKLPIELRLKIFKLNYPGPRRVQIRFKKGDLGYCADDRQISALISRTPVPEVLHVSREARLEAQRYYKLCFGIGEHTAAVYFNFELDTLHIGLLPDHERDDLTEKADNGHCLGSGEWEFEQLMEHGDVQTLANIRRFAISTTTIIKSDLVKQNERLLKFSGLERFTEIYTEEDYVMAHDTWGSGVDPDEEIEGSWSRIFEGMEKVYPSWQGPQVVQAECDWGYFENVAPGIPECGAARPC